ncbi:phosphatidylinositol 4,5-bisphosphate 5-phosphatase A [Caerostris extrusa]|uniref:Phosphatidylinositol 4,5-bisphosphate 5-phosphatase A n=1 Tax=Caerostris extrusa TaxID=172846 RepID=A0AAV4V9C9_CAEEX|nr:phosphatidylinositol 4,5-bisphosphate 5-phosphatase A [Caerostris extrusa]
MLVEDPWIVGFRDILQKWDYVKLKQLRLQGMSLYLFCKRGNVTHIRGLQTSYTRTGLGGMWAMKVSELVLDLMPMVVLFCLVNLPLLQLMILNYNKG